MEYGCSRLVSTCRIDCLRINIRNICIGVVFRILFLHLQLHRDIFRICLPVLRRPGRRHRSTAVHFRPGFRHTDWHNILGICKRNFLAIGGNDPFCITRYRRHISVRIGFSFGNGIFCVRRQARDRYPVPMLQGHRRHTVFKRYIPECLIQVCFVRQRNDNLKKPVRLSCVALNRLGQGQVTGQILVALISDGKGTILVVHQHTVVPPGCPPGRIFRVVFLHAEDAFRRHPDIEPVLILPFRNHIIRRSGDFPEFIIAGIQSVDRCFALAVRRDRPRFPSAQIADAGSIAVQLPDFKDRTFQLPVMVVFVNLDQPDIRGGFPVVGRQGFFAPRPESFQVVV